ncbi:MAG TPA: substrate-binding domain-containing protein [Burkholderiales bacterium]|nr:substrate-binding domain-containing protein [Burkholderiales bacterium]
MKVIISGGFEGAYRELLPEFERAAGVRVQTGSGASQGTGPQVIAAQLARGVPADVVILSREGLNELIAAGRIAPGTDRDLASTPIGAAVRKGAPKPDVRTVQALERALLEAGTVAVPGSTSGIFLVREVFPRLGLEGKIDVRVTPRGTGAAAMVAAGEARLALLPVSEILAAPAIELAGRIAPEIQLVQVFSAASVAGTKELELAQRLIAFLGSQRAAAAITRSGMDPLARG